MNYYPFHVGDYRSDTSHLSLLEHGIYRQLIDWYYLDEHCIPAETQLVFRRLQARTDEEKFSVQTVLDEFFRLTPDGYSHSRCDAEIAKYQSKAEVARSNGKSGGRPKKTDPVVSGLPQETGSKANQEPRTKNHQPSTIVGERAKRATRKCPETFEVTDSMLEWVGINAPNVDYRLETARFMNHTFKSSRADWEATWRNWLLKANEDKKARTAEPAWRAEQRNRTQQAAPGVAVAFKPADQFFLEMEKANVAPRRLD